MKKMKAFALICILLSLILFVAGCAGSDDDVPVPEIKEGSFPFSITYKLNGETFTISDTMVCRFIKAEKEQFGWNREWEYYFENKNNSDPDYVIYENELGTLYIWSLLDVEYFMSDPFYMPTMNSDIPMPVAVFKYNDQMAEKYDSTYADSLEGLGFEFEIVSWDYPEPLENEYVAPAEK